MKKYLAIVRNAWRRDGIILECKSDEEAVLTAKSWCESLGKDIAHQDYKTDEMRHEKWNLVGGLYPKESYSFFVDSVTFLHCGTKLEHFDFMFEGFASEGNWE